MTREKAITIANSYFASGQFRNDLETLVAYETESQNPDKFPVLRQYLSQAIGQRLQSSGFDFEIFENPITGGGPILTATRIEDPAMPTVLTYGHGDVVLGQADRWREGLHPYKLIEEGDRLYGRGTADNKAQHLINMAAIESVLATRDELGFNLKIMLETSEETGSPGLQEFVKQQSEKLAADVLIASDGPRLLPGHPTMFMGSRNAVNFTLSLKLREGSHHSGNWGGLLADPAIILSHALASICDARGQISVPEWRPGSLTDDVRSALAKLPVVEESSPRIDPNWGEESLTPTERAYGWNTFVILAMTSGTPEAPVNAIAPSARAFCQLRYVVGTDPQDIIPALRRHLDRHGFQRVGIETGTRQPVPATRMALDHPWVEFVQASLSKTAGVEPHMLPNFAGGLPNEVFADTLNLPTIWIPHSYPGCSQHAPDEHVLKPTCRQGLKLMTGLFWDIGTKF